MTRRSAHGGFLGSSHRTTVFSSLFTQVDIFKSAYAKIPTKMLRMEERNVYCGTYFTTVLLNRLVKVQGQTRMSAHKADLVWFTEKTPIVCWTTETDP